MRTSEDKRSSAGRFDRLRKRQHWVRHLPWVVLAATLAGSWQLWRNAEQHALQERKAEFDLQVREATAQVRQRMGEYEQLLYGVRGFLASQRSLDHAGYSAYIRSLELPRILPGIEGISYAPLVQADDLLGHTAAMRRDGLRTYRVRPRGGAAARAPVAYIEPPTAQNLGLLGLDSFAEPARRLALDRSRDTGQPVISDQVMPREEGKGSRHDARLMLLAIYRTGAPHATVAERRASIAGWIAVSFQVGPLVAGLSPQDPHALDIELSDGRSRSAQSPSLGAEREIRQANASASGFSEQRPVDVGGRTWVVSARALPTSDAAIDQSKARLTALSAVLLSIVLTWLTAFLVRDRSRALRLAEGVNSELERNREFQSILQESERRWKLALEAVGDGVWDWDLTTNRMTYSPHFEEMLGYAPGELEREHDAIILRIHPEDRDRAHRDFLEHLRGETATYVSERRVLCKDGSWKWMLARGMAMDRGPDGRYRRMIGTHTDISRRRAMEQALQDARRISDDIINSLPGVFYMFDAEGRLVRWNRNTELASGYAADEISRLKPADFFAPQDLPAVQRVITQVFESGAEEFEAMLRLKNGDRIPYQFTARRTAIAGRHYLIGVGLDISARRAAEAAVRENDERYRAIFSSARDFIFTIDTSNRITSVTDYFCEAMGYSMPEVVGAQVDKFFTPESMALARKMIALKIEMRTPVTRYEADLVTRHGRLIPVEINSALIFKDGKLHGSQGIARDITERRHYEEALRESERRWKLALEAAGHGVWDWNMATGAVSYSPLSLRIMGCADEDRPQTMDDWREIIHPGDLPQVDEALDAHLGGGARFFNIECRTMTRTDGWKWIASRGMVVERAADNSPLRMLGTHTDISEQKEIENALRLSEAKLQAIIDHAPVGIWLVGPDGRHRFVNKTLCDAVGVTEQSFLAAAKLDDIIGPDAADALRESDRAALASDVPQLSNEVLTFADGKLHHLEVRKVRLRDHLGNTLGVLGISADVTEQREREEAVLESEEKYRGLFESAGDFAYSTDLSGNFVAASESLLQVAGYQRGELRSIAQILSPEQLALAREMTAAKVSGAKRTTRYELEITARKGVRLPLEIVSTLVYRQGKPVGVQGIGRDMAERKRAEEMLRRSERNYRELMEQAAEAIFVADHEGQYYVDVNQAACDLLGYTRQDLIGTAFASIFHPEDIAEEPIKYGEMWSGEVVHTRCRFRRKDGSYVPVELSTRMLSDGRLQALGRDISNWIEREAALQQSNLRVEAASRAKSEFLANMSHEIRTPMNSVLGMARLALARETEARQIGYLEKILMSGEHLLGIIDDILDFSKIEAGKVRIERTSFDLRAVMESLKNLMADKAIAKGLQLTVEMDPGLPDEFQGDPLRLRQVLLNFVDNAIKFTSRGRVSVAARREAGDDTGSTLYFEVADTGIGLSEAEMAMLFRPFQQSDGSVTRKYGGTGLGLSISKRLVELMGGEAGVESAPGQGARFWFRLRLDEGKEEGLDMPEQFTDQRDMQAAIRGARILLAENNVLNQQVAREFLELAGCQVQVAGNGHEVLDLLQREPFDCILMDIQMPSLDGLEATRQIRANPAFAALPVIAVTANAQEEERQRCLEAGMNDFVTKPLRPETLYAVLAKWLSRQTLPFSLPDKHARSAAAAPRQAAAIDFAVLSELVGGNPEKMRQMAHKFLESAQEDMEKVRFALERADLPMLKELGHHIKSPAAMVGAGQLAGLCQALETNQHDLEAARDLVGKMQGSLAAIEGEIREEFP